MDSLDQIISELEREIETIEQSKALIRKLPPDEKLEDALRILEREYSEREFHRVSPSNSDLNLYGPISSSRRVVSARVKY